MTGARGKTFGLIGALRAFPRRTIAREVERQRGELQHRVTRRTSHVVFGRSLLAKWPEQRIRSAYAGSGEHQVLSENGFLRELGLMEPPAGATLTRQSLLDQSKLLPADFDLLRLFDGFENDAEPFSFRDLILAKKYAGLIAGGATWDTIARSVHRSGPVASLTALSLQADRNETIYARLGEKLSELDGQGLLPLDRAEDNELEELFEQAEDAEEEGRYAEAAARYERCIAIDPHDAIAAFNRGNCLQKAGRTEDARVAQMGAIKRDPKFVEAWFNLAGLEREQGKAEAARRHFQKAIALDGAYADAVFNLANLEYEAGDLAAARKWWSRYLELDSTSDWAKTAMRGIQYADLHLTRKTAS